MSAVAVCIVVYLRFRERSCLSFALQ